MLDVSVTSQHITYPTDLNLINKSREETERLIDILHVDDLADAYVHIMNEVDFSYLTIGLKALKNSHIDFGYWEYLKISEFAYRNFRHVYCVRRRELILER